MGWLSLRSRGLDRERRVNFGWFEAVAGGWYHRPVHPAQNAVQEDRRLRIRIGRALIEVAFIVFLFYSNLLMGEFTAANGQGKTLVFACRDIFTLTNFSIALIAALIGHGVVHYLRKLL